MTVVNPQSLAWLLVLAVSSAAAAQTPKLEVKTPDGPPRVGESWLMECTVRWEGAAEALRVLPAEAEAPGWAGIRVKTARATVEDGTNTVTQTIEVRPVEVGSFELPALRIPYQTAAAAGGGAPARALETEPLPVTVTPERVNYWWGVVAVTALLVLIAAAWAWSYRRKWRQPAGSPEESPAVRVQSIVHDARRCRLDGDFYRFYTTLAQAAAIVDTELQQRFEQRAQEVGYQNIRPADDELDGALRDVEGAAAHLKEEATV